MELHWKPYKTKKEADECKDGEEVVGWGSHPGYRIRKLVVTVQQMLEQLGWSLREGDALRQGSFLKSEKHRS